MATNFTSTGVAIGGDRVTAHAWAHFDSTGTPAIQDDFGFASIAHTTLQLPLLKGHLLLT